MKYLADDGRKVEMIVEWDDHTYLYTYKYIPQNIFQTTGNMNWFITFAR